MELDGVPYDCLRWDVYCAVLHFVVQFVMDGAILL